LTTGVVIALLGATDSRAALPPPIGDPSVPEPNADPFYAPPADLASSAPGTVLRSRPVTVPGVNNYATAHQLLYRTTDGHGQPIATVTTLFVPSTPAPGPRHLLSFHVASDSLTMKCSPSYTLRSGTGQYGPGLGNFGASNTVQSLLNNGWDVAVPDYEGPDSQWTVGLLHGYTALDGIRAVEQFAPAGLDGVRTKVAMAGYSGGSIPTQWAASLARTYAPELNIVAAASGGSVPDLIQDLAPLEHSPFFGTVIGVAVGVDRAYPDLGLDALLNAKGRALAARDAADADGCGGSVTNAPGGTVAEYSNYPTPEAVVALPHVRRVFARLNLIRRPAPAAPSLIFHSAQDELAWKKPVDELVAAWCARGALIDYRTPPGDHLTGSSLFGQQMPLYIRDRFAGVPATSTCPPGARTRAAPKPALSSLRVSPGRFSAAGRRVHGRCAKPTRRTRREKPCRRPIRLRATYMLNAAVTVSLTLVRKATGRKVRSITDSGFGGSNSITFTAKLAAGTHELTATPEGGAPRTARLKVTG
jgi:hypothetical protein